MKGYGSGVSAPTDGRDRLGRPVFAVGLVWLAFLGYPAATLVARPSAAGIVAAVAAVLGAAGYFCAVRRVAYGAARPPWGVVAYLTVAGVVLPLAAGSGWLGISLYAAVLLGLTLPPGGASAAAGLLGLVSAGVGLLAGTPAPQELSVPLLTVLAGVVAIGARRLVRIGDELRAARREAEQMAAVRERMHLARELHDAVKQQVFVAAMEVGTAQALLSGGREGADDHLSGAAEAIGHAQRELATLIDGLRIPAVDDRGLGVALHDWADQWSRRHGIEVTVVADDPQPVHADQAEALLRGAQEALTNVARHSRARHAQVVLAPQPDGPVLTVSDDGAGFRPGSGRGQGLRGIRERLEIVGGSLTVASAPGQGTVVRLDCSRHQAAPG